MRVGWLFVLGSLDKTETHLVEGGKDRDTPRQSLIIYLSSVPTSLVLRPITSPARPSPSPLESGKSGKSGNETIQISSGSSFVLSPKELGPLGYLGGWLGGCSDWPLLARSPSFPTGRSAYAQAKVRIKRTRTRIAHPVGQLAFFVKFAFVFSLAASQLGRPSLNLFVVLSASRQSSISKQHLQATPLSR